MRVVERAHVSIGEVLSLLKEEFPDITISKIRFLESQGLLDPERTPSGYRKFYDADVERLRWILRQQREHFLPLKVIKGRLVGEPGNEEAPDGGASEKPRDARPSRSEPDSAPASATAARNEPVPAATPLSTPLRTASAAPRITPNSVLSAGPSGVNLTMEELSSATGLPYERLRELERFGFITGRAVAGSTYFDEESLVVANLAAGFARFGIEARHLRTYKNAAEREAGLLEQVVTPLLKQRNPESRSQAVESLAELSQLGQNLRAALLRQAVRGFTGG
ncbi:MAG TPA: MerR family transcriptional regulator [Acidimicrobiales bacterium]|nr:MerR family transcriptional regulator [Acidimicrobiales bacterium]